MKHRFCNLDCFNCKFPDCYCPDAECVNGLHIFVGEVEMTEIDEEERERRRAYQKAWREAHPEKVKEYNKKYYKREK